MYNVDPASHRRNLTVLSIWIAVIIWMEFFNWTHRVQPSRQAVVRGQLIEWSELKASKGGKTPRFTIIGFQNDFRIDPYIYADLMNRQIPNGFAPGEYVEITADSAQISSPDKPLLNPNVSIVWVNGLTVGGRRQFDVADVIEHEKRDRLWFFPLIGVPLALLGYVTIGWRRNQKHRIN